MVSKSFRDSLSTYFAKLDDGCHTEVNPADGKTYLREWKYTSQFNNPSKIGTKEYINHRHISHLMGLYPCSQISEDADKSVFEAARTSLIARGDGHGTGWSLGHKINLNARAYEGQHCHNLIKRALQQTWDTGTNEAAGGIYENLWDAHAPYQIVVTLVTQRVWLRLPLTELQRQARYSPCFAYQLLAERFGEGP